MTNDRRKTDVELIDQAEKLDAKATPGPWAIASDWSHYCIGAVKDDGSWSALRIVETANQNQRLDFSGPDYYGVARESDANLIADARTLLPELAARLKAANEKLAQAERALKIAGVPISVGLVGDRALTDAEKAGARKYEAKAKQLSGIIDDN